MWPVKQLNSADRRTLRARAHALHPVVIVSSAGLADSVVAEIERCLKAHELIKIRVFSDVRLQREQLLAQICERTGASAVQHIGKILVVYRAKPEPPAPKRSPAARLNVKTKAPPRRKPGAAPRGKAPYAGARPWSASQPASRPTTRRRP
jgi:putative YhbY family RNA-binding protein